MVILSYLLSVHPNVEHQSIRGQYSENVKELCCRWHCCREDKKIIKIVLAGSVVQVTGAGHKCRIRVKWLDGTTTDESVRGIDKEGLVGEMWRYNKRKSCDHSSPPPPSASCIHCWWDEYPCLKLNVCVLILVAVVAVPWTTLIWSHLTCVTVIWYLTSCVVWVWPSTAY